MLMSERFMVMFLFSGVTLTTFTGGSKTGKSEGKETVGFHSASTTPLVINIMRHLLS